MTEELKKLPIILLKTDVLFPNTLASIFIKQKEAVNAIMQVSNSNTQEVICTFQHKSSSRPKIKDIYTTGVKMVVSQIITMDDSNIKIFGNITEKVKINEFNLDDGLFVCSYSSCPDVKYVKTDDVLEKIHRTLYIFNEHVKQTKQMRDDESSSIKPNYDNPLLFSYIIANKLNFSIKDKQELLESSDVSYNLDKIQKVISQKTAIFETETKIHNTVKEQMTRSQKEFYLNEQVKAIHKELGINDTYNDISVMEKKIKKLKMTPEALRQAKSEIQKIKKSHPSSHEAGISKAYLDHLLSLPWGKYTRKDIDVANVKEMLDSEHYGLDKVKENIIEYISVMQRIQEPNGQILCFVGPPGVGKTSLVKSIAKAIKKEFGRFALGGVHNESEMRGHRRTYIGAMPGRIIRTLQKTKTNNPVILLDEIDKVGFKNNSNNQSDITSALLEILDKEQNKHFVDNYIEVEYDISKTTFIATANSLDIQDALMDRMHIIQLSGYTEEEKVNIALQHLIPKQKKDCGLSDGEIDFDKDALYHMIHFYTREAGVRNLDRLIQKLCQKVLVRILNKEIASENVTKDKILDYLGEKKYLHTTKNNENTIGVANGLAYTSVGGDILHIESVKIPGDGKITLTGKLGKVMEESAKIAFSCFKSNNLDIDYTKFNLHVHVPSGAVPKDGPSAGITLYTSMHSLLLNKKVRSNVGMTGEINLQGKVLAIGGLKEKMLGAIRGGLDTIIVPEENKKDLTDIPENVKSQLKVHFASHISDVLKVAIED